MSICIYGEVALDWLISKDGIINSRKGGAGLYAALSAARLGKKVEFLTVLGPEIDEYHISVWSDMGVSFKYSKNDENYCIPKYLVTGFENYGKKVSRPMSEIRYNYEYVPDIPAESKGILLFPINHSIQKNVCIKANKNKKIIFLDPKLNKDSLSDARELLEYVDVLLVNEEELLLLSYKDDVKEAIEILLKQGPKYIVVKRGIKGCIMAKRDREPLIIPSYKSNAVCTLGSGDVFDGALVSTFIDTEDMEYSIKLASCMAARFIQSFETEDIPTKKAIESYMERIETINYSSLKDIIIYLAGPFFSKQELTWANYIQESLEGCGLRVLSPSKQNGIIDENTTLDERQSIFIADLELIQKSDIVVALLDHNDSGTNFEIGYAYSNGKPIIALQTSNDELNNMIKNGCNVICNTVEEVIFEVYKYATE